MIFIPGVLISALTFPGVMIHELAHQLCCRLMGVPVYSVVYFQFKRVAGYVHHEPTDRPLANFVIATGPFFFNTLIGVLLLLPVSLEHGIFGQTMLLTHTMSGWGLVHGVVMILSAWLGVSVLMHAFPSSGDAKALVARVVKNKEVPLVCRILVAPVVGLIYVGAIGSVVWLDLAYALAMLFVTSQLATLLM